MNLSIEVGEKSIKAVQGLGDFIKTMKEAASDGFQPGDDIPEIATAALTDLLPIITNLKEIEDELKANPDSRAILAALLVNDLMAMVG